MISAINYISEHCHNVTLILRIDDDVLFHPKIILQNLTRIIQQQSGSTRTSNSSAETFNRPLSLPSNTIACRLISDFGVWRFRDHPNHFYAVDDTVLPGKDMYPPFCAGFFVAMSGDVPRLLQPHILTDRPFWMDDRYMGILQMRAETVNVDISSLLDFGYAEITRENLEDLAHQKILVKHLPGRLKLHLSQLFQYLDLSLRGLRDHFETIIYK